MRAIFTGTRYANVTSTLALIVALGGTGAYAASKITSADIGRRQVKNANLASGAVTSAKVADGRLLARDFAKGQLPRGATGAQGPAGSAGPALPDVLPPGQTLHGSYSFSGFYSGANLPHDSSPADGQISFPIPLVAAPQVVLIKRKQPQNLEGDPTAVCPGNVLNPQAAPGYLCVYESRMSDNVGLQAFSPFDASSNTATRFGVGLEITGPQATTSDHRTSKGSWAVTAP